MYRSIITKFTKPGDFFCECLSSAKVVSIDIFNTILLRELSPEMVIKKSSERFAEIFSQHAQNVKWPSVYEYRRIIEERLKSLNNYKGYDPDCRLTDIVDNLCRRFLPEIQETRHLKQELIRAELQAEATTLKPLPEIIPFLNKLRETDKIVVFLSDMYLSANDIFDLLKSFSLHKYFKAGFTSGDQLLTKKSGRLFQLLFKKLKVSPNQVVHIGDHLISDYRIPKSLGIHAFLYLNLKQKFRTHKQRYFLPYAYRHLSVVRSLSRNKQVRRESRDNLNTIHHNTAKFVLSPIFLTFVENIVRVARAESVEKIYFVARDGFIFYKYFKKLCLHWGFTNLIDKANYVFFSRVTLLLASTRDIWKDGLQKEGWKLELGGLAAYLRGYGISPSVIEYFCKKHQLDPYKKRITKDVLSNRVLDLSRDPEFIEFIKNEKERQTKLLESYFTQIGFFSASKVIFVDIGWHGTIYDRLYTLYGQRKNFSLVHFEYFGFIGKTNKKINKNMNESATNIQKGFYFDSAKGLFDPLTNICSGAVIRILENCCRTVHGSVIGYKLKISGDKNHVVPIFGPSLGQAHCSDIYQMSYFRSFFAGLKDGFVEWAPSNWEENSKGFAQRINLSKKLLMKAISGPSLEEAATFLSIPYQQDGGVDALQTLQGFSFKMFLTGNRSVWIPGNLTWHGLNILNSIYIRLWTLIKIIQNLRIRF